MPFDAVSSRWFEAMKAKGHSPKMDVYDEDDPDEVPHIDMFASASGIHNGPACTICGWSCCHHCTGVNAIPDCKVITISANPAKTKGT